jgi:ferredoxin
MLIIDTKHCLRCAGCIGVCPELALCLSLTGLQVDQTACTDCGLCIRFCPVLAVSLRDTDEAAEGGRQ